MEIYNTVEIDWTNFHVSFDDCQNDSPIKFELMPEEYLQFAKNNLKSNTRQGCIDAIGNAKRAIECQIDILISTLGYDYRQFDSRSAYPEVKEFINKNYKEEQYSGITERLKLLNILGLAPTLIISNIRYMRNEMEHEYNVPPYEEVKKAVEVAELFINSSNRKLSYSPTTLEVRNRLKKYEDIMEDIIKYPFIEISFYIENSTDTVRICVVKDNPLTDIENDSAETLLLKLGMKEILYITELKPEDKLYIYVIYCLLTQDCNVLPMIFNSSINEKYINYTYIR